MAANPVIPPAIELKGNLLTLMVLRILSTDLEQITAQLADKVAQAPNFFYQAPLVLDFNAIQAEAEPLNLSALIQVIRQQGLVPVAVRSANEQQQALAVNLSLGVLAASPRAERAAKPIATPNPEPQNTLPMSTELNPVDTFPQPSLGATKIITQPVRSGQQVVNLQGDLIILAAVSPGAEILAHGHIHVYGALRGRALAGVNGDTEARIFCQQLEAELVSVAGHYQVNEELPDQFRGKSVQIFLADERLKLQTLEPSQR